MKKILLVILLVQSACSTIYFHKDASRSTEIKYTQWHHGALYGLVELSEPVEMDKKCKNWKTIRTQQTFIQGFVEGLTSNLYNPNDVGITCAAKTK